MKCRAKVPSLTSFQTDRAAPRERLWAVIDHPLDKLPRDRQQDL